MAQFDPQFQAQRLDDYKDSVVQLENTIRKMLANLAATKEAHDQDVRTAKADWESALLDLKTADVRSRIDAEKFKLTVQEDEAKYKQLVAESALVDESQRAPIRSSELNRDQSKIELQRAEANVKKMTIKAPMDGIVVMQSIVRNGEFGQIREGDQVFAGQPFMQIVDPRSMVLNATVNQVDAETAAPGNEGHHPPGCLSRRSNCPGTLVGIGAMSKTSTFRASYRGRDSHPHQDRKDRPAADSGSHGQRGDRSGPGDRHAAASAFGGLRRRRTALTCSCRVRKAGSRRKWNWV